MLQLLRLIFFGSYYPVNPTLQLTNLNNSVNKRPSTEPITTLAKKTITPSMISCSTTLPPLLSTQNSLVEPPSLPDTRILNVIQKIGIAELTDITTQLLTIFWAAAAGNLQLACGGNANLQTNSAEVTGNNFTTIRSPRTVSNSSSSTSSITGNVTRPFSSLMHISNENLLNNKPPLSNISSSNTLLPVETEELSMTPDKLEIKINDEDEDEETDLNPIKPLKGVKFFLPDQRANPARLSTGSNMSTCSMESGDVHSPNSQALNFSPSTASLNSFLQNGICIKQTSITKKDIKIAAKAIEMIACFFQYRKDCVSYLLNTKLFNECVIDVLTGSISPEIRGYMEKFLLKLCQIDAAFKCKDHLINLIIKARLPLWANSSLSRTSTQRLILQSTQYFNLRSALLENMTIEEQSTYSIDLGKMLNDEVNWIIYFTHTKSLKHIDNILLNGHLCLTRALLTCETANKVSFFI